MATTATYDQLANYLVSGSTSPHRFGTQTITYSFAPNVTEAERALARAALGVWDDVANISFDEVTGPAQIRFQNNDNGAYAQWSSSNGITSSATINIGTDWLSSYGTSRDSYTYQTYIHEIGHALGLGHQGPYNGSADYGVDNIFTNDTWQFSVMSYFDQHYFDNSSKRFVMTPQMADIIAIQSLYGTSVTRADDTVYGFNSNAGALFNFSTYSKAPAFTIFDSGGSDTLDCSGYSFGQTIDIRSGNFSSVGGLVNNIGIAVTASLENAIGGSGADTLIGNALNNKLEGAAGNDVLNGGIGEDVMRGGLGNDTYFIDSWGDQILEGTNEGWWDTVFSTRHAQAPSNVERLFLQGSGSIFGLGNSGFNEVWGNEFDNTLYASLGGDSIVGGLGHDNFVFLSPQGDNFGFDKITIIDFSIEHDSIVLSTDYFSNVTELMSYTWEDANGDLMIASEASTIRLLGVSRAEALDHLDVFFFV